MPGPAYSGCLLPDDGAVLLVRAHSAVLVLIVRPPSAPRPYTPPPRPTPSA
jgi:hypothetical protein